MKHLNIGDIVKEHGFHEGWDEEWKCWIVDEERLLDWMEEVVNPRDGPAETGMFKVYLVLYPGCVLLINEHGNLTGFVIDHHDPSLFPERWIDLAVVLTCDNGILHDRLTARCVHVSFMLH